MSYRPFKPGVRFLPAKGKLYIFSHFGVVVLLPWPRPLAYRKTVSQPQWQGFRPLISLKQRSVSVAKRSKDPSWDADILADTQPQVHEPGPAALAPVSHKPTKEESYNNYIALIPPDVREAVNRFPKRQWHMLQLAARVPGGLDLMSSNPALAFMVANSWSFHRPSPTQPLRAARSLVRKRQREITVWLGFPRDKDHPESIVKILKKVVPAAISVPRLLYLRDALQDPKAAKLMRHIRRLNSGALRFITDPAFRRRVSPNFIAELSTRKSDDRVPETGFIMTDYLRMVDLYGPGPHQREIFNSRRRLVQAHDELAAQINAEGRPPQIDLDACFPPHPFPGDEAIGIEPLTSPADLVVWGAKQRNCIVSYGPEILRGKIYLYKVVHARGEEATLSLLRRGRRWSVGQLKGPMNKSVSSALRETVLVWLESADSSMKPDLIHLSTDWERELPEHDPLAELLL